MNSFTRNGIRLVVLAAVATLSMGGCTVIVDGNNNDNASNNNTNSGGPPRVHVTLANETNLSLDPEIFILSQGTIDPNLVFQTANRFTRFGIGTRGLLGPGDIAEFDLDCEATYTLATFGGALGEDLDNPTGRGTQRILLLGSSFTCGDNVTLTFSPSGNGFVTTVAVSQ